MTGSDAARWIARGRVAIGVVLVAAPAVVGHGWIGDDADRPPVQAILRAVGIRDLILGALTLHVIDRPGVGSRTVATCAVADVVDAGAILAARDSLDGSKFAGAFGVAAGSALAGAASAIALR